jgi:hypothetical protein
MTEPQRPITQRPYSRDLTTNKHGTHLGDSMAHSAIGDYPVTRHYPNPAVCVSARLEGMS